MGVYIKNWLLADWKELLKWAKIGANNAMIGEFTEAEEVPPHGRLIDADVLAEKHRELAYELRGANYDFHITACSWVNSAPTIVPASEEGE